MRPKLQLQIDELTITGQVGVVGGWTRHQAVGPTSLAPLGLLRVAQAPSAEISRCGLAAQYSTLEPQIEMNTCIST